MPTIALSAMVPQLDADCVPEAAQESMPDLEIVGEDRGRAPASDAGTSTHSVAKTTISSSARSVAKTTLSNKGLNGTPIAEKHISQTTGKPYWRFRNSAGKGYYYKKEEVERLGFAWYPNQNDPSKGVLKNPKTGRYVSHEHARTIIGSQAGSDVANLDDLQSYDGLDEIDEDHCVSHEHGRAIIWSQASNDVENLDDLQSHNGLDEIDEDQCVSHERGRTILGSQASIDVANLDDLQSHDGLDAIDKDHGVSQEHGRTIKCSQASNDVPNLDDLQSNDGLDGLDKEDRYDDGLVADATGSKARSPCSSFIRLSVLWMGLALTTHYFFSSGMHNSQI